MTSFNESERIFYSQNLINLQIDNTSKGNQKKWYEEVENLYIKSQFYYQEKFWRDDLVEIIASRIREQINCFGVEVLRTVSMQNY